jgi:hypothetical protein
MPRQDEPTLFQGDQESPTSPLARNSSLPEDGETDDDLLIRWMLNLTPAQRLQRAQGFVNSVLALRHGRRS